MNFLGALAEQISSQYSLGENTNTSLDAVIDGNNVKYGALGEFASKFDQSAERKYVEEGYLRKDAYNTVPKQLEVLMQEPNATILIKKRMFSSIAENFNTYYMDYDEKLYLRCIKILLQNKCNQIATLEKLSKIQKITSLVGEIDNYMIPLILNLTDSLNKDFAGDQNTVDAFGVPLQQESDSLVKVVDRLRRIYSYNISSPHTSWIVDNVNSLRSSYGEGTGVIEITNFSDVTTNVSVDMNQNGSCNFNIEDPYQAMLVTDYDIEKAIADGTNLFYKSSTYQMGKESAEALINELQVRLNQYRSERGASPLTFKVNPDTLLSKRVRAIIDRQGIEIPFTYNASESLLTLGFKGGKNVGVEVPEEYLKDGNIAGFDGLDNEKKTFGYIGGQKTDNTGYSGAKHKGPDSELNLFCRLIKTIFDRLTLIANSANAFQTANIKTNYVRRKLRFNFLGKLIIQPSDVVHVYITSKSRFDNKLLGGLSNMFNGLGFLQKATQQLTDLKNSFDAVFNPQANVDLQVEKAAFVGSSFPTYLWNMVRSQFINENEGVHVFGGIVKTASDSWNNGSFKVSVTCSDNSEYFTRGKVNFKPGADVFNGRLFDPLTPFKSNFDTVTSNAKAQTPELLEENKWLISEPGTSYSPLSKYKHGPSFGKPLTEKSLIQDKSVDPLSGLLTKTIHAPDGLVYKWKEGIGVMIQSGNFSDFNDPSRVGFQTIYKEPFAGQDIMNVLSLLITGVPYNFATYWKAIGSPNYGKDHTGNKSSADNYYESLRGTLSKNNLLWGNFIPFKNLTLDEATYNNKIQTQIAIIKQNDELNSKLEKLRDIYNEMAQHNIITLLQSTPLFESYGRGNDTASPLVEMQAKAKKLEEEINTLITASRETNDAFYTQGKDVSFDISDDYDVNIGTKDNPAAKAIVRRKLRRQLNYLTRRMSYNVRANDDKNLFIVDDFYDKDYDILAYNQDLGDMKLFSTEFVEVKGKITSTANLLNLEVFCDTQGHVRVRPPQYNRMPSSIFYKMMYMKETLGIQVFPQFLSDLFGTQLDSLKLQIEIVEDYIRFYCAVAGYDSDFLATDFIRYYSVDSKQGANTTFDFVSTPDGAIVNINDIIKNANPELQEGGQGLDTFNSVKMQAKNNQNLFRTADRAQALVEVITNKKLLGAGFSIDETDKILADPRAQILANRIFDKSGKRVNIKDYISTVTRTLNGETKDYDRAADIFKIINDLSIKIGERQKAVKLFYSTIKNYSEYRSLDDDKSTANKLLAPGNYSNSNIPEVFEHMIEDETYDDLGPGSGQRYVIKSAQIKSMSFTETAPPQTYIEVQGTISSYLSDPGRLPASLASFPGGGNAMTTAGAIDYDMWRNYGFIGNTTPVNAPFLRDPATQCAPFATMLLSRSRKEVLKGTLTIKGNEYMQPGEVIFLEDRGLLFYVSSVKHNFGFKGTFETTLELSYGHAPGEYIPTTLDVMGKMLYNNRDLCNFNIFRQSGASNENPLGVVHWSPNSKVAINNVSTTTEATQNKYNDNNLSTISNILYSVQQFINKTTSDSMKPSQITRVELRIYYDDQNSINQTIKGFAETVKATLLGNNDLGANASYDPSKKAQTPWINNDKAVQIKEINLSDVEEKRSPSQKAISMIRDLLEHQNVRKNIEEEPASLDLVDTNEQAKAKVEAKKQIMEKNNQLRANLFEYIVDCWIVYEDIPATDTVGSES